MKWATVSRSAFLAVFVAGLSACGKTMGPYPVEVVPHQKFELHAISGKVLTFEAQQSFDAMATYLGAKKAIQLNVGTEVIQFSGARFDKETGMIIAPAEKTGQRVGVAVSRSLACNPECEIQETHREFASCTYYMQERYSICRPFPGGVSCVDEWRSVPRAGNQWVEIITTTRKYDVKALLVDVSNVELAKASGAYTDRTEETRALSACF